MQRRVSISLLLVAAIGIPGCTKKSSDAATANQRPGGAAAAGGGAAGGAAGGGAGGAAGAAGRPTPSVTLAASDVMTIRRSLIEESTPIAGDLHPIETVDVKARIEGDIAGVYAREGQRVRAGEMLARFEASEQASAQKSAQADRISARGDLATAQWTHEQNQELFKAGAIPERDLRTSEQSVNSARARLAAAESRLKSASVVVGDTRVVAPLSGIVEKRLVENGEHVARGVTMFTVVRNDILELAASVPAKKASGVASGQLVYFNADGREFTGKVARVSPTIDPATRAITVYVQIPNTSGALKGGTFASGRVVGRSASGAIAVPAAAIRQGRDGLPFAYRINGKLLEQRKLTLGIIDEVSGMAEVREGLTDGDRIIVGNVGTLGAGMTVTIVGEREQKPGG